MKRKFFAYGLSLLLLLAQNSFVFAQTAAATQRSTDELVALLDEPEAVVVVNVRKMLTEVAPTLLNNDPATVGKVQTMMRSIEDETGVNPFALDKIVFGMKLGTPPQPPMIVLQTSDAAAVALAENMYQNQLANAKLSDEINPLKNRVVFLESAMAPIKTNVIPQNQSSEADLKVLEEFQTDLGNIKAKPAEQARIKKLKTDSAKLSELLKNYETLSQTVYNLGDLPERLEASKKEIEKIPAKDAQRAAKIAAANKTLTRIEQEFMMKRGRMLDIDDARMFGNFGTDSFVGVTTSFAAATAAERSTALMEMQTSVDQRIENVNSVMTEMKSTAPSTNTKMEASDAESRLNAPHPISTIITRKEEIHGGKRMLVFTTIKKFPERSPLQPASDERAMLIFDDRTLLFSDRAGIVKSLENKSADRSRTARNLILKSGDALLAFGVDLRSIDLTDLAKAFGEQKTALQAFGALSSAGNDLSLTATIEKSDIPLNLPAKTGETNELLKVPAMTGGDAVGDLLDLLIKSIVGVEGKLTIRFEKKKAAAMLDGAPRIFSRMLSGVERRNEREIPKNSTEKK